MRLLINMLTHHKDAREKFLKKYFQCKKTFSKSAVPQLCCFGVKRFLYFAEPIETPSMISTNVLHFIS